MEASGCGNAWREVGAAMRHLAQSTPLRGATTRVKAWFRFFLD